MGTTQHRMGGSRCGGEVKGASKTHCAERGGRVQELGLGSAEVRVLTPPPMKRENSLAGVLPFAGVGV